MILWPASRGPTSQDLAEWQSQIWGGTKDQAAGAVCGAAEHRCRPIVRLEEKGHAPTWDPWRTTQEVSGKPGEIFLFESTVTL
jgi:hypothetical protein